MADGLDIFGNLTGTNAHGNAEDTNIHGERPKDGTGNPPKDIFGNQTGTEEAENQAE